MTTIERLKKLMIDEKLTVHAVSVLLNIHSVTISRWLKTGKINVMYEKNLNEFLTSKNK